MGRAEQYHTRRYGGTIVQEQPTYVAPEPVNAPAASDPRPSYGRGTDGEYRIGGKTKREAMEEARQAAIQRAIAQGVTNRNKQENAGYDAAKRAKRHWQAEYESQRGFNIPALQAGARPGEQVINGQVAKGGLVPNAQSWQSVGGQRVAQSQRQRFLQGRASDQEQYRRAASIPGTYRLSDGSVVSSSLAVGNYGNFTVKMRREPIGNTTDGGYLYNTTRLEEQRQVTGFNLFDMQTQAALRANAKQYKTTGELYGAAQASYAGPSVAERRSAYRKAIPAEYFVTPTFRQQMSSDRQRMKAAMVGYTQDPLPAATVFGQSLIRVPGGVIERWSQRAKSVKPRPSDEGQLNYRTYQRAFSETESLGREARTNPNAMMLQTGAAALGGFVVGKGGGWLEKKAIQRYGPRAGAWTQRTIAAAGVSYLGYEAATAKQGDIGRNLPSLVAGGVGFNKGYRSMIPKISVESISRASAGRVTYQRAPNQITGRAQLGYTATLSVNGKTQKVPFIADTKVIASRQAAYRRSFIVNEKSSLPKTRVETWARDQQYAMDAYGKSVAIPKGAAGFYDSPNTIYMADKYAKTPYAREILGHERGHQLSAALSGNRRNGRLSKDFTDAVRKNPVMAKEYKSLSSKKMVQGDFSYWQKYYANPYQQMRRWYKEDFPGLTDKQFNGYVKQKVQPHLREEAFAELYKARELNPKSFREIAPSTDRWFVSRFSRNQRIDVTIPGRSYYDVAVRQSGKLNINGLSYQMEGSWRGAMNKRAFFARNGDMTYMSRTVWSKQLQPTTSEGLAGERARASMSEYAVLKGRDFPAVQYIGRARTTTGSASYNKLAFNPEFGFIGRQKRYASGGIAQNQFNDRGVNTRFFNEAFLLGEQAGLHRQPRIRQRTPLSRQFDDAFFPSETNRLYSGIPAPQRAAPRSFQEPIFEQGRSYKGRNRYPDVSGLPFAPGQLFNARAPAFSLMGQRGGRGVAPPQLRLSPRLSSGTIRIPSQSPRLIPYQLPRQRPLLSYRGLTTESPRTSTGQMTVPGWGTPPGVIIPNAPPVFPRFPFPGVGGALGGGMAGGAGTSRKYRYAPSLVALEFGIKRKKGQRRGGFTGLELRGI